jgi:hypothetical protein
LADRRVRAATPVAGRYPSAYLPYVDLFDRHALQPRCSAIVRVLYAILCDEADERPDGRIDVRGIFHQLYAPAFPAQQERMVAVVNLEWDSEETGRIDFRIDMLDPSGSPAITISGHTDVGPRTEYEAPPQSRIIIPLEGVVFPTEGSYELELHVNGARFGIAPLHLIANPDA